MTVLLNLKSLNHINKVSIKSILSNNYNLFTFEKNIIKVSKNINQSDCVYIKGMGNHLIYVLGEKYLNKNFLKKLKEFIITDVDGYIETTKKDDFYIIKVNDSCDKTVNLKKFSILN